MLRVVFIITLLIGFAGYALRGPVEALVLYLWLAYFRPESWAWTPVFMTLPLSMVAGVYLFLRVGLSSISFKVDRRVVVLFSFLVIALIATEQSRWYRLSQGLTGDISKAFLVTYLMALLCSTTERFRIILITISMSLGFEQAKQGWARLIFSPGSRNDNSIPMFGDNNGVAAAMMMLVPLFLVLARLTKNKYERWLYWFMTIGVLYRGLSTYSRGGFLAAIAMALVFIWRSPKRLPALVAVVTVATVVSLSLPQEYWNRMNTVRGQENMDGEVQYDNSAASRLFFWQVAVRMANDNFFGVGPGAFPPAYPAYDTTDGAYGKNRAVHSSWFGALSEMGYLGLLSMILNLSMAWLASARAQRLAKRGEIPAELGLLGAGFESSLVAYSVAGTFLNFQYVEMFWHIIGLTIALQWTVDAALQQRLPGLSLSPFAKTPPQPFAPQRLPVRRVS